MNPGLGERIIEWLRKHTPEAFAEFWRDPRNLIWNKPIAQAVQAELHKKVWYQGIVAKAVAGTLRPEDVESAVNAALADPSLSSAPIRNIYTLGIVLFTALGASSVAMTHAGYRANRLMRAGRLDPMSIATARYRQGIDYDTSTRMLHELGLEDSSIRALWSLVQRYLDPADAVSLWLRGELGGDTIEARLDKLGYNAADIGNIKKLSHLIPGPADLVRMAVREAWRDDVATRWGYDEDFVEEFGAWMAKQGMGGDWPKYYWRAHWELPSITLAMEMLHRTEFSEDDFADLLRIADIPRGYRDLIKQIAYLTYTRVDTRRMHATGVLDRAAVKRSYLDQGYNEERAEHMTEFTILYNEGADKELAKSDLLDGYRKGLLTYSKALGYLIALGYRKGNAEFYLAREDWKAEEERMDDVISTIKANYVSGLWNRPKVWEATGRHNVPEPRVRKLLSLWSIERERRVTRPSVAKLEDFYLIGSITERMYREEMRYHGYVHDYIDWYVDDIETRQREALEKLKIREQKEALARKKFPSKSELRVWLTNGIIQEPEYRGILEERGYSTDFIDNYLTQIMTEEAETRMRETLEELEERLVAIRHPTKVDLAAFLAAELIDGWYMTTELVWQGFHPDVAEYYTILAMRALEEEE